MRMHSIYLCKHLQLQKVSEKCQKEMRLKSTNTFHSAALEPNWLCNSFCQRRGGRPEADSAACNKPPPPHTCRSHDDPNTVSSSSRRPKLDPAPCLRSAYFKPFPSPHLSRSLALSAGSRQLRHETPVAPVGVETIC